MGIGPINLSVLTVSTAAGGTQLAAAGSYGSLYLEADESNTGKIYIGDINVSATRYMTVLSITATASAGGTTSRSFTLTASYPERPGQSQLDISKFYALASAASQKLHITGFERMGQ